MKEKTVQKTITQRVGALLPKWKPSETEKLIAQMDAASVVMSEVELLLEEIQKCEEKLAELEAARKAPGRASRIPVLRHILRAGEPDKAELQSQITAYRSMLAGLNGHLLQIVLHQCKDFAFLGDYLYPVAVSELKASLTSGAAETLADAINLYETHWRAGRVEQAAAKRKEFQEKRMAKVLHEARTM